MEWRQFITVEWNGDMWAYLSCVLVLNLGTDIGMESKVRSKILKILCAVNKQQQKEVLVGGEEVLVGEGASGREC